MVPDNPILDKYILNQTKKTNPKNYFIPTASQDSDNYISRYYNPYNNQNCKSFYLSLFESPTRDLKGFILQKDIIFVGGLWNKLIE